MEFIKNTNVNETIIQDGVDLWGPTVAAVWIPKLHYYHYQEQFLADINERMRLLLWKTADGIWKLRTGVKYF